MAKPFYLPAVLTLLSMTSHTSGAALADEPSVEVIEPIASEIPHQPLVAPAPEPPTTEKHQPLEAPPAIGQSERVASGPPSPSNTTERVATEWDETAESGDVSRLPRALRWLFDQSIATNTVATTWETAKSTLDTSLINREAKEEEDPRDAIINRFFEEKVGCYEFVAWLSPFQAWVELSLARQGVAPEDLPQEQLDLNVDSFGLGELYDSEETAGDSNGDDLGPVRETIEFSFSWQMDDYVRFTRPNLPSDRILPEDVPLNGGPYEYPAAQPREEREVLTGILQTAPQTRRYYPFPAWQYWRQWRREAPLRVPEEYVVLLSSADVPLRPRTWDEMAADQRDVGGFRFWGGFLSGSTRR